MEFNACAWVKGGDDLWHPGLILSREENENVVTVVVKFENDDGTEEKRSYQLTTAQADDGVGSSDITLRNVKGSGEEGAEEGIDINDLITLTHLHEPSILYTLKERYRCVGCEFFHFFFPLLLLLLRCYEQMTECCCCCSFSCLLF